MPTEASDSGSELVEASSSGLLLAFSTSPPPTAALEWPLGNEPFSRNNSYLTVDDMRNGAAQPTQPHERAIVPYVAPGIPDLAVAAQSSASAMSEDSDDGEWDLLVSPDDLQLNSSPESSAEDSDDDRQPVDLCAAGRHSYLGACDTLMGVAGWLEDGFECRLPLLAFEGCVLVPGETLPLRMGPPLATHVGLRSAAVEQALAAPPPLSRLIAVACDSGCRRGGWTMGCTAELHQIKRLADGSINCLARGRQRVRLRLAPHISAGEQCSAAARIMADARPAPVPKEARANAAAWAPWAWRAMDADVLAVHARRTAADILPRVAEFQGDALALSYWLTRSLPLEAASRQALLAESSAAARLRRTISLLALRAPLRCVTCSAQIAKQDDVVEVSDEGAGALFVNNHGSLYDLLTLRVAYGVSLRGEATEEYTWFPGYSWRLAYCRGCSAHLGWLFRAVDLRRSPHHFWGFKRQAFTVHGRMHGPHRLQHRA
ncbi:hypothetical protein WJX81_002577 [Elliptochloris bilobata]|uniref:Protein cereblon n=1 Tax=Elliptochloris bilobata TaxID=381761 RepID=A0AAW1SC59_9CHLO